MQKVPYLLVVGDKESEANAVAVRARGGVDLGVMPIDDFIARLQQDVSQKVGPQLA
jgi:threonyl-tRNA synthetase